MTEEARCYEKHRSKFVARARKLDPSLLSALRIDEAMLDIGDAIVTLCGILMDSADPRPWTGRLEEYIQDVDHERVESNLEASKFGNGGVALRAWTDDIKRDGYKTYARRLLGAAEYDRLERVLKEDAAVVALAIRRGVRGVMPFAVAWEDALSVMTREQLAAITKIDLLGTSTIKMIVELDALLGEKMLPSLPMELTSATDTDLVAWRLEDLALLAEQFRGLVSTASMRRIEAANSPLVRKIKGARDALEYSADGVSQAANSLIELIDRLMRERFPREVAIEWIDFNLPDDTTLIYLDDKQQRQPTKRAEALCLVYGGGGVARPPSDIDDGTGPSLVHDVLARAIVVARTGLQRLKHADSEARDDREKLVALLAAVEGALMIGLQLGLLPDYTGVADEHVLPETA